MAEVQEKEKNNLHDSCDTCEESAEESAESEDEEEELNSKRSKKKKNQKTPSSSDSENTETLKSFISDLNKALECPICLDVVKHPFKLCARGHLMCVGCLKTLTACPTCQGDLLLESPVCIKNVLENLPHECRYSANGCKKMVKDGNIHENICGFRHIKCRQSTCEQEVLAKELLYHFETVHPDTFIIERDEKVLYWSEFDPKKKMVDNTLVHVFENIFWLTLLNCDVEKQFKVFFEAIPIDILEDDYYIKLSLINGKFKFTGTMKAFIPEENEPSVQEANVGSGRLNQFCMTVPQMMLPHFIEDENLNMSKLVFFKG